MTQFIVYNLNVYYVTYKKKKRNKQMRTKPSQYSEIFASVLDTALCPQPNEVENTPRSLQPSLIGTP